MENREIKDWKTRLRELYLDENDGSSFIKEITFNWGTFLFTPNLKHRPINYYIATQESIEDFVSKELEKARKEGWMKGMRKMHLSYMNNEESKKELEELEREFVELLSKLKE